MSNRQYEIVANNLANGCVRGMSGDKYDVHTLCQECNGPHGVRTVFLPTQKIKQRLRSVNDTRDPLSSCRVYKVPLYIISALRNAASALESVNTNDTAATLVIAELSLSNENRSIFF